MKKGVDFQQLDERGARGVAAYVSRTRSGVEGRTPVSLLIAKEAREEARGHRSEVRNSTIAPSPFAAMLAGAKDAQDLEAEDALVAELRSSMFGEPEHLVQKAIGEKLAELRAMPSGASAHDLQQRKLGAMMVFEYLKLSGMHPADQLRQLQAMGRALGVEPWASMTMHEVSDIEANTPAAHSHRVKLLSKKLKAAGVKGTRLPRQKSEAASESYRARQMGKKSRAPGRRIAGVKVGATSKKSILAPNGHSKSHEPTT